MLLAAGHRLGVYEITAPIGAGGMGQVYRARDTKLNRDVALKVLPEAFAHDPDRLARFTREAQTLALLNHPNIAQIYGLEEGQVGLAKRLDSSSSPALPAPLASPAIGFIVMELVEGPTLAELIAGSGLSAPGSGQSPKPKAQGLSWDEALPIARQIAVGLEAAHAHGIIHRDLKPANIKVRPDGTVKVLDFGLAKAIEAAGQTGVAGRDQLTQSPTITSPAMTNAGVILGTAAYMSPEQARGLPVGVQADVWAFGCVLFEMLSGRSPFSGPTVTDVIAAVVRAEPDWTALQSDTPSALRALLRRCLQKDTARRLHHIGDVRIELDELTPDAPAPAAIAMRGSSRRTTWLIAAPLAAVALALAAALVVSGRSSVPLSELRVDLVTTSSLDPMSIALSPDGLMIVYAGTSNGVSRLEVRSLADGSVKSLVGTEFATLPFWSPDGQSLGFFADGKLKRIELAGGLTQTIAPAPLGTGGSWSRDDVVIYAPTILGPLFKVPARGGEPVAITKLVPNKEFGHRSPQFLSDGQRFIYYASGVNASVSGVYLASLDGSTVLTRLLDTDVAATAIGSGHLLFTRQGTLFVQAFRADRGELVGTPAAIANGVAFDVRANAAAVTAAIAADSLAYRTGAAVSQRQLTWFDRSGRKIADVGGPDPSTLFNPELSPDGRFVVANRTVDSQDVWLIDTARGTRRRFTFDPGSDQIPVWSPDGQRIVFSSNRAGASGAFNLYEKAAERPGAEQLLFETNENKFPMGFSADGRYLLYRNTAPNTNWDLWALPTFGDKKAFPVVQSPAQEMIGEFSPDGHWVAYQTNESGQFEIYRAVVSGSDDAHADFDRGRFAATVAP